MSREIAYTQKRGYQPTCSAPERAVGALQGVRNASEFVVQTGVSAPISDVGLECRQTLADSRLRARVLLFRGRGLISGLIRFQTRSEYSHAALLMPDGRILESWQGAGVRVHELTDWAGIDAFSVRGMSGDQWDQALAFAWRQLGNRYDYLSVLRFVSRRDAPENGRWFCSELVFAALAIAGVRLLARVEAAEVSPGMLAWSPLLEREALK